MKEIKTLLDGKVIVIQPNEHNVLVPLFCPHCAYPMKTAEDSVSFRKYGCCHHCDNQWTNFRGLQWENGGPDKTSMEWTEYMEFRKQISKPIIKLV